MRRFLTSITSALMSQFLRTVLHFDRSRWRNRRRVLRLIAQHDRLGSQITQQIGTAPCTTSFCASLLRRAHSVPTPVSSPIAHAISQVDEGLQQLLTPSPAFSFCADGLSAMHRQNPLSKPSFTATCVTATSSLVLTASERSSTGKAAGSVIESKISHGRRNACGGFVKTIYPSADSAPSPIFARHMSNMAVNGMTTGFAGGGCY